jgi:hypothetical protein
MQQFNTKLLKNQIYLVEPRKNSFKGLTKERNVDIINQQSLTSIANRFIIDERSVIR